MATQFSMLGIINAALASQGMDEIVSLNDGTPEYRVLARNWPSIVEAELEDGAYNFARKHAELLTRTDGKFGFDDAYLLPLTVLHVRRLWLLEGDQRIEPDWTQDGTYVHLDSEDGCHIEYVEAAEPDLWSANFVRGVQFRLEAVIARSMKEEAGDAAALEQQAEIHFQRARTNSSKSRSPRQPYRPGRFADARFGRGS